MPTSPNIKPVPQLPEFRWNVKASRYIAANGRFIPVSQIRGELSRFITSVTEEMFRISTELNAGGITLAQWQTEMMGLVKETNLAGGALERGGWYNMNQSDFGRVGAKVRGEYGYLNNFAQEIEDGIQKLDGSLPTRARLYGEQGRVTYYEFARNSALENGHDEERSIRTPSESCQGCIDEEAKGFQKLGDIIPIGDRECLSNCNCFMEFRNSRTGETRLA